MHGVALLCLATVAPALRPGLRLTERRRRFKSAPPTPTRADSLADGGHSAGAGDYSGAGGYSAGAGDYCGAGDYSGAVGDVDVAAAPDATAIWMETLRSTGDLGGFGGTVGDGLERVFGSTARRRLWTKADFLHAHAATGAYFLGGGALVLLASHASVAATHGASISGDSPFLRFDGAVMASLLLAGVANAVTAVPMARFTSNRVLDFRDLKANGFILGGAGLTIMSCWIAWWFSGGYPAALEPYNGAFFGLWAAVCVFSTINWELMLRQNLEAGEIVAGDRAARKFAQADDSLREKAFLYRLASWPNLTQLLFVYNMAAADAETSWLAPVLGRWPLERVPLFHYGLASAVGYSLSMFSETLRDRKLVTLRLDLIILVIGFVLPMVSVAVDGFVLGDDVTINPLDYWRIFQHDALRPQEAIL
ncbi:hypothetical protein M885DRAFT_467951 [Pelagophyceae sp. CCMP2097]|nr:hypothetical protein M885DRAFT_467951 [Pelagophyceae sp. CCMP2097]